MPPSALRTLTSHMSRAAQDRPEAFAPDDFPLDCAARDLLSYLRMAALACRTRGRMDLFKACALLSTAPEDRTAIADALVRGLERALPQAPVFYRPGVGALSFDEAWLLRAIHAAQTQDLDSLNFLLRSRICAADRRCIRFLIGVMAKARR